MPSSTSSSLFLATQPESNRCQLYRLGIYDCSVPLTPTTCRPESFRSFPAGVIFICIGPSYVELEHLQLHRMRAMACISCRRSKLRYTVTTPCRSCNDPAYSFHICRQPGGATNIKRRYISVMSEKSSNSSLLSHLSLPTLF